jgi:hypothetical protein
MMNFPHLPSPARTGSNLNMAAGVLMQNAYYPSTGNEPRRLGRRLDSPSEAKDKPLNWK